MAKLTKKDTDLIERNFTNHAPDEVTQAAMESFRKDVKVVARDLARLPDSREKSLAITNLEQTTMWGIAAMARGAYDTEMNGD